MSMDKRTLRVLIADGRPRVRSALRLLLVQEPEVTVVGEAEDVGQMLRMVVERWPDLVLLDWELPRWGGRAALAGLRRIRPDLAVIVLSGRPGVRQSALEAGADGFVSKGDPPERLLAAVHACHLERCGRERG